MGFEVRGSTEFGRLARQARLAGADLGKEFSKEVRKAGPPAKKHVQASALAKLPKRNGAAATIARTVRVRVKADTSLMGGQLQIITHGQGRRVRRALPDINNGRLRHPTYGHRDRWVTQKIRSGFWDDAMDKTSDDAYRLAVQALGNTVHKLT